MKIKYKFLLFFVPIFSLALISVSALSIYIFRNDKIAYVFASILENTQTASMMVKSEVESQRPLFDLLISSFDFARKNFPAEARGFLQMNASLTYVRFDEVAGSTHKVLDHLGTLPPELEGDLIAKRTADPNPNRIVFFKSRKDLWALVHSFKMKGYNPEDYQITVVYKRNPVSEMIGRVRYFDIFLVDRAGKMMVRPPELADHESAQVIEDRASEVIQDAPATKEIVTKKAKSFLVAWVPVEQSGFGFISITPKSKAVETIDRMKRISLGFLLLLLSAGLIGVLILVKAITDNIESLTGSLRSFSEGNLQAKSDVESNDETGLMSSMFNAMTDKINLLLSTEVDKARMSTELDTARNVQRKLVPAENFRTKEFKICGHFEPASECGGDWWYYLHHENVVWLLIADVTGHGVASALVTAALRAGFSALQNIADMPVTDFVQNLNRVIFDSGQGQLMCTFFLAKIDVPSGELTYVNASHCPPAVWAKDTKTIEDFKFLSHICGPRLGENPASVYEAIKYQLNPRDRFFAFTDGLNEFANAEGRQFGERRVMKSLAKSAMAKQDLESTRKSLINEFRKFQQTEPLPDDLTFFFFEYQHLARAQNPPAPESAEAI